MFLSHYVPCAYVMCLIKHLLTYLLTKVYNSSVKSDTVGRCQSSRCARSTWLLVCRRLRRWWLEPSK